jgi:formyl-CoA transferase/CoA:oxalate CoA-transferase
MVGAPISDVMAGMFAAFAIVSALRLVNTRGGGQYIDLSMQDATLAVLGTRMGETLQAGISPRRLGNENPIRVPASTYRTADGHHIAVIVLSEAHWQPFCAALERTEWVEHPSFRNMALRLEHRDEISARVAARFAEQSLSHWRTRLEAYDVPYAPVNDYAEALADPQVAHRGLIRELVHPSSGKIKVVGAPWQMSATRTTPYPPPLLGQHTGEVLRDWLDIDTH